MTKTRLLFCLSALALLASDSAFAQRPVRSDAMEIRQQCIAQAQARFPVSGTENSGRRARDGLRRLRDQAGRPAVTQTSSPPTRRRKSELFRRRFFRAARSTRMARDRGSRIKAAMRHHRGQASRAKYPDIRPHRSVLDLGRSSRPGTCMIRIPSGIIPIAAKVLVGALVLALSFAVSLWAHGLFLAARGARSGPPARRSPKCRRCRRSRARR